MTEELSKYVLHSSSFFTLSINCGGTLILYVHLAKVNVLDYSYAEIRIARVYITLTVYRIIFAVLHEGGKKVLNVT